MVMPCKSDFQIFPETEVTRQWLEWLIELNNTYEPYHGVICVVICTFGIVTNVINAVVLSKRKMRSPFNVILTAVALCDMGTMVSYVIFVSHFLLQSASADDYPEIVYSYRWVTFIVVHMIVSNTLHSTSLWLTIMLAVVRVVRLNSKMKGRTKSLLHPRNIVRMCVVVYLVVQALCLPMMFSNQVVELWEPVLKLNHTAWPNHSSYSVFFLQSYTVEVANCVVFKASLWLVGILFKMIPCLLLAVFIGILIHTLRRAKRRRLIIAPLRDNLRYDIYKNYDHTSCMLTIILSVFLITELPQGVASLLSAIYPADMQRYLYKNVGNFLDLLSLVNSSVNFILYCTMSRKFRHVFLEVVLPKVVYEKLGLSAYNHVEE